MVKKDHEVGRGSESFSHRDSVGGGGVSVSDGNLVLAAATEPHFALFVRESNLASGWDGRQREKEGEGASRASLSCAFLRE